MYSKNRRVALMEAGEDGITSMDEYEDSIASKNDDTDKGEETNDVRTPLSANDDDEYKKFINELNEYVRKFAPILSIMRGNSGATDSNSVFTKEQSNFILNGIEGADEAKSFFSLNDDAIKKVISSDELNRVNSSLKYATDFNKKTPKQRAVGLIYDGSSPSLSDFSKFGEGLQIAVSNSINKYGWTFDKNKFLKFVSDISKNPDLYKVFSAKYVQALDTIASLFSNNYIEYTNETYKWLSDKRAYNADDPLYKIKSLIFIHGREASKFGEEDEVPQLTENILNSTKKIDIERYLTDWQTLDGSTGSSGGGKPKTDREKSQADRVFKDVQKTLKSGRIKYDEDKIRSYFDTSYEVGDTTAEVIKSMIQNGALSQ